MLTRQADKPYKPSAGEVGRVVAEPDAAGKCVVEMANGAQLRLPAFWMEPVADTGMRCGDWVACKSGPGLPTQHGRAVSWWCEGEAELAQVWVQSSGSLQVLPVHECSWSTAAPAVYACSSQPAPARFTPGLRAPAFGWGEALPGQIGLAVEDEDGDVELHFGGGITISAMPGDVAPFSGFLPGDFVSYALPGQAAQPAVLHRLLAGGGFLVEDAAGIHEVPDSAVHALLEAPSEALVRKQWPARGAAVRLRRDAEPSSGWQGAWLGEIGRVRAWGDAHAGAATVQFPRAPTWHGQCTDLELALSLEPGDYVQVVPSLHLPVLWSSWPGALDRHAVGLLLGVKEDEAELAPDLLAKLSGHMQPVGMVLFMTAAGNCPQYVLMSELCHAVDPAPAISGVDPQRIVPAEPAEAP